MGLVSRSLPHQHCVPETGEEGRLHSSRSKGTSGQLTESHTHKKRHESRSYMGTIWEDNDGPPEKIHVKYGNVILKPIIVHNQDMMMIK